MVGFLFAWFSIRLIRRTGTYATYNILPAPENISHRNADSEPSSDTRIRARTVHFLKDSNRLLVAYLNHGVV